MKKATTRAVWEKKGGDHSIRQGSLIKHLEAMFKVTMLTRKEKRGNEEPGSWRPGGYSTLERGGTE